MTEKEFREKYYDEVSKQTLETLPKFIEKMLNEKLGYGSVCCAVAASALAAAWAANRSPKGGITGFQACAVMWEFVRQWNYKSNKIGLRIVDYDNLLYSQYEDRFTSPTISQNQFDILQKEAKRLLQEDLDSKTKYDKDKIQYNKDIAKFVKKYPDYYKRKKHYDRLMGGTSIEWEVYEKKQKDGFEFAPQEPFYYRSPLISHWQSIVSGKVPFGITIKK